MYSIGCMLIAAIVLMVIDNMGMGPLGPVLGIFIAVLVMIILKPGKRRR